MSLVLFDGFEPAPSALNLIYTAAITMAAESTGHVYDVSLTLAQAATFGPVGDIVGRFWVGGTGNWNNAAHWAATTGGPGGVSLPTSSQAVFFDSNSGVGIATINV